MKNKGLIIGGSLVVFAVIIGLIIYLKRNKSAVTSNQPTVASNQPTVAPCVPFTKKDQDAQKSKLQADCAAKLLIPFVGQAYFAACLKAIPSKLTPITSCFK